MGGCGWLWRERCELVYGFLHLDHERFFGEGDLMVYIGISLSTDGYHGLRFTITVAADNLISWAKTHIKSHR